MSSFVRSLALAAAAIAVASAPAQVADARQNSQSVRRDRPSARQYINVNFCNRTSDKIYLALSYLKAPGSSDWIVEGWKNINGNSCMDFDLPSAGWFYYYAEDDAGGTWGADDIKICVEHPGPFRRVNVDGYTCDGDELKGFRGVDPGDNASYTVNIRP